MFENIVLRHCAADGKVVDLAKEGSESLEVTNVQGDVEDAYFHDASCIGRYMDAARTHTEKLEASRKEQ